MQIAYTMAAQRGEIDTLLQKVARTSIQRGYRPVGTVQINSDRPDAGPCDMDVKVLPDGPVFRISQSLGAGAKGCRLDPFALEAAVARVDQSLLDKPDFLLINKFGKHEADGRGFRATIAEALARDIPVLVGLNTLNAPAFMEFTAGTAIELAPSLDGLLRWLEDATMHQRKRAVNC